MMRQALVIGASGGIGSRVVLELLQKNYKVTAWSSQDLDLNYPERIFTKDLSQYDVLVNCAGHSQGTYLGFVDNTWQNQVSQITVNYTSNLMLAKHYAQSRSSGQYVWISTILLDSARPFHSIYASTKAASKIALDLVRQDATHISIIEVKVGPTKTNFRYRNFLGSQSQQSVNSMYDQENSLSPQYVAAKIVQAIELNQTEIHIK
jgi:short-subunit dehydrogenase